MGKDDEIEDKDGEQALKLVQEVYLSEKDKRQPNSIVHGAASAGKDDAHL